MTPALGAALLATLLRDAHAEDPPVPTTVPEAPKVPDAPKGLDKLLPKKADNTPALPFPWRITVFEDLPDSADCDEELGLRGLCFEEVRFAAPPDREDGADRLAEWRNLSIQMSRVWEGLTYRWTLDGDPIKDSIVAAGYTTLPSAADAWEAFRGRRRSVSVPDTAAWLQDAAWTGSAGSAGFLPRVRYKVQSGGWQPPEVVLHGRFASRLGADGRPFDYDLMDAAPSLSLPFFEQMYPYSGHDAAGAVRPLAPFDLPPVTDEAAFARAAAPLQLADDSIAGFRVAARARFDDFYELLSTQVAQFSLEDYTLNQMRVLTALAAMETPPPEDTAASGGGRQIVAAARGETDEAGEQAKRIARAEFAARGIELNVSSIPVDTVSHFVDVLYARVLEDRGASTTELDAELRRLAVQDRVIRPGAPVLEDPRSAAMTTWANQWVVAGIPVEQVVDVGQRAVLSAMLEDLAADPDLRARYQTAILLDQVQRAVVSTFDGTPGARATPQAVVSKVADRWATVLGPHGFAPHLVAQGLGAVDPTAICTTKDRSAALGEPSFGAVNLDVLVTAPDGGDLSYSELVAKTRDQLPFLFVDNPGEDSRPLRLVGLPSHDGEKRALYRIRWRVWTGWHLFWTADALPNGGTRLAVRTGAICDDTTLASPELVPTLLRASLLDGDFRNTRPVPYALGRKGTASVDMSDSSVAAARGALAELKAYMRAPLDALATREKGVLVVAADVNDPSAPVALNDLVPHTPYARFEVPASHGRTIVSAVWARFLTPGKEITAPLVYPAFRPGQSVESDSLWPRWVRVPITNFTFTGGLGYFPIRASTGHCQSSPTSPGFVEPCDDEDEMLTHTEGFSADMEGLTTFWLLDHPRLGVETGLEVRLDTSHSGLSWTFPDDGGPSQTWMFRPAGGVIVGLRSAPRPAPLTGFSAGRLLWGADRVDGSSRLGRLEYGLRGGFLMGPSYLGAEGTLVGELWGGVSARRNNVPVANLTPYNPASLYGIFVRGQYGFTLVQDVSGAVLRHSEALVLGVRGTWDLQIELPEAPKAE